AIDEYEFLSPDLDDLRWKVDGGSGAGTNQLPKRKIEIAIQSRTIVVFRRRIIGDRPRRVCGGVAQDHHQERSKFVAAQRRFLTKFVAQSRRQFFAVKLMSIVAVQ